MPQVINTNVMSLNAQRNLTTSGNSMSTAIQRLSSGLRINSAKDDARRSRDLGSHDHADLRPQPGHA